MTVAEDEGKRKGWHVLTLMVVCSMISAIMIIGGWRLTQRQIDLGQSSGTTQVDMKMTEFKLKSTYPGIAFILCGTFLMIAVVRKEIFFKTQHKDDNHPGYTEIRY
jgi:TRAP-type C4-dicarboxylate transport system permease small subunit